MLRMNENDAKKDGTMLKRMKKVKRLDFSKL